jgi:Skp family chaperone for outer membrane proteins
LVEEKNAEKIESEIKETFQKVDKQIKNVILEEELKNLRKSLDLHSRTTSLMLSENAQKKKSRKPRY